MHLSTIDHDSRPPSRASRRFKSRFTVADNDVWLTNPVNSSPSPLSLESFTVDQLSSRLSSLNVAWFEFFSFFRRKKEQKKRDYRWLNVWLTRWERERETSYRILSRVSLNPNYERKICREISSEKRRIWRTIREKEINWPVEKCDTDGRSR